MFPLLLLFVIVQRLLELAISSSNTVHLRRRGAVEYGAGHYPVMVALHAFWLLSCLVEWWSSSLSLPGVVVMTAFLIFCFGQWLRWNVIKTLKRRWTTRVLVLPGAELVKEGPFRFLNHPNYLGVSLELFALPLVGGCWKTALTFGSLNLLLLTYRIRVEERALKESSL